MKNLFNRTLSILCAVMLLISVVSAWAAAEEEPASPTNLNPAEQEIVVDPVEEEIIPEKPAESATDCIEVSFTKALTIGQGWEGTVTKEKLVVLKLDVTKPRHVYVLIEGKNVWVTKVKSDNITKTPSRLQTDSGTEQLLLDWGAEEGSSYLITLGPVEPINEAKAKVTIMDKKAYEAWMETQTAIASKLEEKQETETTDDTVTEAADDTKPETAEELEAEAEVGEETEAVIEEEPEAEIEKEAEPQVGEEPRTADGEEAKTVAGEETEAETAEDSELQIRDEPETVEGEETETVAGEGPKAESEKKHETGSTEETKIETKEESEADKENEEEGIPEVPNDETLLSLGYYKVQVVLQSGADIVNSIETEESTAHLSVGDEIWVKPTENELWAEIYMTDETISYIKWDVLLITMKPQTEEPEKEEEAIEEELPARGLVIHSTIENMRFISIGDQITMTAEMINFREDDCCSFQWQYFDQVLESYVDIEGANEQNYSYFINDDNLFYKWKLVVVVAAKE